MTNIFLVCSFCVCLPEVRNQCYHFFVQLSSLFQGPHLRSNGRVTSVYGGSPCPPDLAMTLTCGRGQDQTKTGWPFIFIHQINCYVKVFLIANWTSQLKMDRNQFYKNIRQLLTSFTCIIRQINISKLNSMSVTFFSCYKGFIWQLRILYMHATRSDRRAPKLHTVLAQYLRKTLYIQSSK